MPIVSFREFSQGHSRLQNPPLIETKVRDVREELSQRHQSNFLSHMSANEDISHPSSSEDGDDHHPHGAPGIAGQDDEDEVEGELRFQTMEEADDMVAEYLLEHEFYLTGLEFRQVESVRENETVQMLS